MTQREILTKERKRLIIEFTVYILVLVLLAFYIFSYGPVIQLRYGHDVPLILDGAWRIQNGQKPHMDFSSIVGYGHLLQQYFFLKTFNYNLIALTVSSVATTCVAFAIFTFIFCDKKLYEKSNYMLRGYIFLLIISLGLGQYSLGSGIHSLTYASLYNRYCFLVLLILLLIFTFLNDQRHINLKNTILLIAAAFLMNYLFFSKFTYLFAAIIILFSFVIFNSFPVKMIAFLSFFSLCIFLSFLWISNFNLPSLLTDYKIISAVRSGALLSVHFVKNKLFHTYNIALLLCSAFFLYQLFVQKSFRNIIVVCILGFIAVILHFTNYGEGGERDIVLLTFIPCLLISNSYHKFSNSLSVKLLIAAGTFFIAENILSILIIRQYKKTKNEEIVNRYVKGLYVYYADGYCNEEYPQKIMSGVGLINRNKKAGEKVFAPTFENPFPVLTNTVPPRHDLLVWQYGFTFSRTVFPAGKELFQDVNLIIDSKCADAESSLEVMPIYRKEIKESFKKIDEDKYWVLYRKVRPL